MSPPSLSQRFKRNPWPWLIGVLLLILTLMWVRERKLHQYELKKSHQFHPQSGFFAGLKIGAWWNLVVEAMVFQTCELVTEVQFTAKEEDSDPVIRRIVEPSGSSFQGLDLTIEPLADRIGNTV